MQWSEQTCKNSLNRHACLEVCVYFTSLEILCFVTLPSVSSIYRDTISGAVYPHVNMCIPVATIMPVIAEYLRTKGNIIVVSKVHLNLAAIQ